MVLKLASRELQAGETVRHAKKHSFRPISRRKYFPGKQALEIQVNGMKSGQAEFS
jgi:hypothetical protein